MCVWHCIPLLHEHAHLHRIGDRRTPCRSEHRTRWCRDCSTRCDADPTPSPRLWHPPHLPPHIPAHRETATRVPPYPQISRPQFSKTHQLTPNLVARPAKPTFDPGCQLPERAALSSIASAKTSSTMRLLPIGRSSLVEESGLRQ